MDETGTMKLNLRQKLLAVMADVGNVPKEGQNTQGAGYKYQRVADMYPKVQKALIDHGVAFLSSEKAKVWLEPRENRNGTVVHTCHVDMEFTLLDTESDEKLVATHGGEAFDTSDKSLNKAKTAALKYFLKQTLLIAEEDEDTEKDTHEVKRTERKKADSGQGSPKQEADGGTDAPPPVRQVEAKCSPEQVDELFGLILQLTAKAPDRAALICNRMGIADSHLIGKERAVDDALTAALQQSKAADFEGRVAWLKGELEKAK